MDARKSTRRVAGGDLSTPLRDRMGRLGEECLHQRMIRRAFLEALMELRTE